jgi:hypothetical protein
LAPPGDLDEQPRCILRCLRHVDLACGARVLNPSGRRQHRLAIDQSTGYSWRMGGPCWLAGRFRLAERRDSSTGFIRYSRASSPSTKAPQSPLVALGAHRPCAPMSTPASVRPAPPCSASAPHLLRLPSRTRALASTAFRLRPRPPDTTA